MDEAEWVNGTRPEPMLDYLQGQTSARKLRLFGVACCRLLSGAIRDERSRAAIDIAEDCAEGRASLADLEGACLSAYEAFNAIYEERRRYGPEYVAKIIIHSDRDLLGAHVVARMTMSEVIHAAGHPAWDRFAEEGRAARKAAQPARRAEVRKVQSGLLRDIIGNPFRHLDYDPGWSAPEATTLAQAVDEARDFGLMPALGDALEGAGCTSNEKLSHCREPGDHVRGCWVLDVILGKF